MAELGMVNKEIAVNMLLMEGPKLGSTSTLT